MSRKPAHRALPPELAHRVVEVGECMEWLGVFNRKAPMMKRGGKFVPVRRWIALQQGMPPSLYATCGCGNWRCVNPNHTKKITKLQHHRNMSTLLHGSNPQVLAAKISRTRTMSAGNKIGYEKAQEIRDTPERSAASWARELGVVPNTIRKIRRGEMYKHPAVNPFAGLMR